MLFVCLAHFANAYQYLSGTDGTSGYVVELGMVASPTFVTMSGLVAGFLFVTRQSSFTPLRYKLVDRGLFLMIVGHTFLALSSLLTGHDLGSAFKVGYITDAIGFAVILGPWLVATVSTRLRLLLAAAVFTLSWVAVLAWTPVSGVGSVVKHYVIGVPNLADWTIGDFPLLPWFAVYLAGTVIGETLGLAYTRKRVKEGNLLLAKIGVGVFGFGVLAKAAFMAIHRAAPEFLTTHINLQVLLSSYEKFPPGPVYLAFFGGAGMLMVAAVLESGRRGVLPFLLNQLRQIGLASLFVYVLQYYVYVVVIRGLHLPYTPFWPAIFLASVVFLARAATIWNAAEGNRYLTIGVGPLLNWMARRGPVTHSDVPPVTRIIDTALPPQPGPPKMA